MQVQEEAEELVAEFFVALFDAPRVVEAELVVFEAVVEAESSAVLKQRPRRTQQPPVA